ncbi:alpha/beta fold hydrolase [Pseudonocardia sp. RS11V-5]|uniref:alpha/beta fold hydrolase n=1 Tax=Pseudonocardia terrae TaxID=2905831 RepID=UPI001E53B586|nr:alpha/beta fold hydrolase [Pseudonocardia terrae]MCE3551779.1 alpha/beta fold hydrolase [Pseudonocardia terrae]
MARVHHRHATVDGQRLFYRDAGPLEAPAVVLLHGFPASSFMFRHLIQLLADRYRVIAPDHLGFGLSDAPSVDDFTYTFDALAGLTADLLSELAVDRYALYVQDYGAPVGWRPDAWEHDFAQVSRPGNDLVQLALFADYASNLPLYPKLRAWRDMGVPVLAVWGPNDEIFRQEGALAFAQDAPSAEIHLLDGGHFLLESHLDPAASLIRGFLARTLS